MYLPWPRVLVSECMFHAIGAWMFIGFLYITMITCNIWGWILSIHVGTFTTCTKYSSPQPYIRHARQWDRDATHTGSWLRADPLRLSSDREMSSCTPRPMLFWPDLAPQILYRRGPPVLKDFKSSFCTCAQNVALQTTLWLRLTGFPKQFISGISEAKLRTHISCQNMCIL
jgi:hypothetical protein